jgi:glycosyltransferase involved in cell wall biosynthesis
MNEAATRLRIVHVVHERIGTVGGIQRFDARVLAGLSALAQERDFDLEVIAMHGVAPEHQLPSSSQFASANGSRRRLLRLLWQAHRRGVDQVLVGHVRLAKLIWPIRLLFRRTRYVLFAHGVEAWDAGRTFMHRAVTRWLFDELIDDIVAVSRFTAARMTAAFRLERPRIHILPNAVNVDERILAAPCASSVPSVRRPVILTVARMDRHDIRKGIPVALQAIQSLRETFPDVQYRVVGDGALRPRHEALARALGISEHVEFLGRVQEQDLPGLYMSSDAFLLPSSKEGFGIVFLEAWRYGLPIVCGNVDASTEVVDDGVNGFTVSPSSAEEISNALHRLLSDADLMRAFVQRGREKVVLKFSAGRFFETLERIIDNRSDKARFAVASTEAGPTPT